MVSIASFIPQAKNQSPWGKMIERAVGLTHANHLSRKLREAGEIGKGTDPANPRNLAALIFTLFTTDSIRHYENATWKFTSVYSAHSKRCKKYNNGRDFWPANTFLTILFSEKELLDEVEKIEFSTRNGDFRVYYKGDQNPEWFSADSSGAHLDHEGKEFEPVESDKVNIVTNRFLERIYQALNGEWPEGIK